MTIVIFAGPTIRREQILDIIEEADIRPPVAMGDVYNAAKHKARAIGIIDGYFEGVPSVWHKEILWALDQHIPVFGASSMGALRAAELHAFGMTGIGRIFEAFRDGDLENDDAVAVHHGPAETGYLALSEPLVNIRATLEDAVARGVVDPDFAEALTDIAKALRYPERNWDHLLDAAKTGAKKPDDIEILANWLPKGRIDQKREDAIAMLQAIDAHLSADHDWQKPDFTFEWTVMWDRLTSGSCDDPADLETILIFDQLRCDLEKYRFLRRRAAEKTLDQEPDASGEKVSREELTRAMTRFRTENGLFRKQALDDWLARNSLDMDRLERRITDEIRLERGIALNRGRIRRQILDDLKSDGSWTGLARNAGEMSKRLEREGAPANEPGLTSMELALWYFERLLELPVPDDLDHFLQINDYADRAEFERMLRRQHAIWGQSPENGG